MVIENLQRRREAIVDPETRRHLTRQRLAELAKVSEATIKNAEKGRGVNRLTKIAIDNALAKLEKGQKKEGKA